MRPKPRCGVYALIKDSRSTPDTIGQLLLLRAFQSTCNEEQNPTEVGPLSRKGRKGGRVCSGEAGGKAW